MQEHSSHILDNIPVAFSVEEVLTRMRISPEDADLLRSVERVVQVAESVARPKAMYAVRYVEERDGDRVRVGHVWFESRVLRINLAEVHRVFPYVATCGRELEDAVLPADDFMAPYIMDTVKLQALGAALSHLFEHLRQRYALGETTKMSPGRLEDWPITEQAPLFALLGDVEEQVGVRLSDSFLMFPVKSVSGLLFPTEASFESCQLCPREGCPNRRAEYEEAAVARYGIQ